MAVSNTQALPVQLETVRKEFPKMFDEADTVYAAIVKRSKSTRISPWSAGSGAVAGFRIPVQQYPGGVLKAVSLDDGDLGTGNMPTWQYMAIGYFALALNYLLPTLTMYGTETDAQSIVKVWKDTLKEAIPELTNYADILFHTAGDGILATANGTGSPANTNPQYQLEPNFGPQRLRLGQTVDVYNTGGTVLKGTGLTVASNDVVNKTTTLTGTVGGAGAVNTDIIALSGLAATLAAGSSRLGLYNFNSSATSGTTLTLSRTTVPELVTPNITASSGLSPAFVLALKDQLIQRRQKEAYSGIVGIAHMAQRAAAFFTGDAIAEAQYRGESGTVTKNFDRVPQNSDEDSDFTFGTVVHMVSKRQDRSRLDWVTKKNWGRVNLKELDFFKKPNGDYVFEDRSSSGTVKTGMFFSLIATDNIYCADPGANGMITALTLPPGY
jgi:hypothetical protein